jgi:RNA polymerase sigma factor (sigma-70 family)
LADLADAVAAQAHLETLLGLLPPRQRLAVVLRVVEGYSEQETARLMRCAPGTVKSSLARGLARLREVLGGRDTVVEACHE